MVKLVLIDAKWNQEPSSVKETMEFGLKGGTQSHEVPGKMEWVGQGKMGVEMLPPIQSQDSDAQMMEHDRRRKKPSEVKDWRTQGTPALVQIEGLDQRRSNYLDPATATCIPKSPSASNNPFCNSFASKNPFVQTHTCLPGNPPSLHHSHTTSVPNSRPQQQHCQKMFPTIQSSSGKFNFTHIGGNQNTVDSSYHITNSNMGNTTTTITTNSNNNSSIRADVDEFPMSWAVQKDWRCLQEVALPSDVGYW